MGAENVEEDGEHSRAHRYFTRLTRCNAKDMPPLIDNPSPNYTFLSGNTPLSFASASTAMQNISPQPSSSLASSPVSPLSPEDMTTPPASGPTRSRPHGKRRDPSYIPRPPNAFILFRCAFVKEQAIPGKVEGNHSKLSKIIGHYWKTLAPEEREKWEAKAVLAQEEHRALYPDWRFRPGANALAKQKVMEELGSSSSSARRRSVKNAKDDSPSRDGKEKDAAQDVKGKGKAKASKRVVSLEETRCAKIAGFVAEGIRGKELEVAVKAWEGDHKLPKANTRTVKSRNRTKQTQPSSSEHEHVRSHSNASSTAQASNLSTIASPSVKKPSVNISSPKTSKQNSPIISEAPQKPTHEVSSASAPSSAVDPTANSLPLTHMFKRSLSAPIPDEQQQLCFSQSASESPSEPPSADEYSPLSAGPIVESVWGDSYQDPVLQDAPRPSSRSTIRSPHETIASVPMPPSGSATGVFDSTSPRLTWQDAENQRRMEELHGPDMWWSPRPTTTDSLDGKFAGRVEEVGSAEIPALSMGYDTQQGGNDFDRAYAEQYGQYGSLQSESHGGMWTTLSSSDANSHTGLVTVINDPYIDVCDKSDDGEAKASPSIHSPTTFSHPPPLSGSYYEASVPPFPSPEIPSTSYSTLTGWAGDYKHDAPSNLGTWPSGDVPAASSYYHGNPAIVAPQPLPTFHRLDAEEWDRFEYRAARGMQLPTEPPRQVEFMDELRRMHGMQ
ncbi:hypothetical protein D9613_001106 [Agrocybe pediades]|uniref:HMG box domain-containing protein n=1 Tax=Agrocybe pediades TaxID=84607 RepID=A0A8H4R1L3_9AGAR|nr:hypothetical protein D9613_001106 [Agrocybe pediades]